MSKLLGYRFKVLWTPGKNQCIADALSRAPVFREEEKPDILVCTVLAGRVTGDESENDQDFFDPALEKLIKYATEDKEYQKVRDAIKEHKELHQLPKPRLQRLLQSELCGGCATGGHRHNFGAALLERPHDEPLVLLERRRHLLIRERL